MRQFQQHIPLQGALNFRDFGGYTTQQGRRMVERVFFRSDKLSELTSNDHATLADCNIGHIFDLRRPDEVKRAPTQWQASEVAIHHYSIIHPSLDSHGLLQAFGGLRHAIEPGVALMENLYRDIGRGEHSYPYFTQLFQRLLDNPDIPILVHCSGGKDRTGSTCALIQWVLGCDKATIFADYMLSKPLYCDKVDPMHMVMQLAHIEGDHDIEDAWLTPIMEVRESYLAAMFEGLHENFPDPQAFLHDGLGLPANTLDTLRAQYTTKT